ncbi:MAG: hypothetical protein ACM31I_07745 [Deltaproteobacteria bacterium]
MRKACLAVALLAALPTASRAFELLPEDPYHDAGGGAPVAATVDVYPFVESHAWEEVSLGLRTSEDKGEVYGAGAQATFESGAAVYRLKGEYFQGTLDSKGVSSGVSWTTEAQMHGFRLEGDLGSRFRSGPVSFVPNVGFGYRWWRRDYRSSPTVIGLKEEWQTGNAKAGILAEFEAGRAVVFHLEAAGRYGVFASNEIMFNGSRVRMEPGGRVTPYAEAGVKVGIFKGSVYYERLAFEESDPVPASGTVLVQPEMTADIYGARIGLSF